MKKIPLVEKTFANDNDSITLHYPNVRYAKENKLLKTSKPMPIEMITKNMELCGFNVISCGKYAGAFTKITTKCCNINCEDTGEKDYHTYITNERFPLCASCIQVIQSINLKNKRPIVAIKGSDRIEFESVAEAGRQLNITKQNVYNYVKRGATHRSGYRFEFLD